MATYNKRGFKSPKPKEVEDIEENVDIDAKDSTTAGVFNKLDEGASKTEEWVVKNQKYIFFIKYCTKQFKKNNKLTKKYIFQLF